MYKPIQPDKFEGNQYLVNSDRVLFNAKNDAFMVFADKSISFSTNGGFHINGGTSDDSNTIINTKKIQLGLNAKEPVLLGDTTGEFLKKFMFAIENLINVIETQIAPVTATPGAAASIAPPALQPIKEQLLSLKTQIDNGDIKSNLAFVK